jgi:hypothetical protein
MGVRARTEAERWGWEAATSVLRNVQYEKAMVNFHSRAFGGFGANGGLRSKRASIWNLLRTKIAKVLGRWAYQAFGVGIHGRKLKKMGVMLSGVRQFETTQPETYLCLKIPLCKN